MNTKSIKELLPVGQEVSIVGNSDYKNEVIDGVIVGFHTHATTGELMYRVSFRDGYCETLASLDTGTTTLNWGGEWKIVARVPESQVISPALVIKRLDHRVKAKQGQIS